MSSKHTKHVHAFLLCAAAASLLLAPFTAMACYTTVALWCSRPVSPECGYGAGWVTPLAMYEVCALSYDGVDGCWPVAQEYICSQKVTEICDDGWQEIRTDVWEQLGSFAYGFECATG
jgi:hypothetical protein